MGTRRVAWLLVLGGLLGVAWYVDLPEILQGWLYWLASHPDAVNAFNDPLTGRTDALLMLVSFFLLTPIFLLFILLGLVFVLIVFLLVAEPLFRVLQLPLWTCVPLVLLASGVAAYIMRATWFPQALYVLGLTARAGIVFFSTAPPVPR